MYIEVKFLKIFIIFKIFSYEESTKSQRTLLFCLLSTVLKKFKWDPCKYELQVNEVNVPKGFRQHVEQ